MANAHAASPINYNKALEMKPKYYIDKGRIKHSSFVYPSLILTGYSCDKAGIQAP
jgi:hypothetical protein